MIGIGVLVSGSGTNLQAILDAGQRGELGAAAVRLVISNVKTAHALERAERAGVPTRFLSHQGYPSREAYDDALVAALKEAHVEVVALAGFMRMVTARLLDAFPGKVVNIHPSLLPAFPGLHAQKQALEHGVRVTGCTVHLVDGGCDTGPILSQAAVPVETTDTVETLSAKILAEEHRLYPQALRAVCEGRVVVTGRRAIIRAN
jgi:phosphoribosylglycinamide formyltransferase-1